MKNIVVRKATLKDLPAIVEFNRQLCQKEHDEFDETIDPKFPNRHGQWYFKKRITKAAGCAFIAEVNKQSVGYLVGGPCFFSFRKGKIVELENMYTLPEWRGKGAGTKLIKKFFAWAKSKKAIRIRVDASFENTKAIKLYKRAGFFPHELILEKKMR